MVATYSKELLLGRDFQNIFLDRITEVTASFDLFCNVFEILIILTSIFYCLTSFKSELILLKLLTAS